MCGRLQQTRTLAELAALFGIKGPLPNLPARWNIAPTQDLAVVRFNPKTGERALDPLRWGLVPSWARDVKIGIQCFNARSETVAEKPAFRDAYARRRCVLPIDGFYEWQKLAGGGRQPFAVAMADGSPMPLAGLWENWKTPEGTWMRTVSVVTTTANALLRSVHERMPVVLAADQWGRWLGEEAASPAEIAGLMAPCPPERLRLWPVDERVGNVRNDDPGLWDPIGIPPPAAIPEPFRQTNFI